MRIIARLDLKGKNLIKGVHLEGLRVVGSPAEYALEYYQQGIDELIYMDSVASLYGRNSLGDLIRSAAESIFVPITVGGGIRSVADGVEMLRCGADKVAINTAAVAEPKLIQCLSRTFGSQSTVLSIEAKEVEPGRWEALTNNGRERTGLDVVEWAKRGVSLGAGEILLTSVDREGTRRGFDIELVRAVTSEVDVPVIASGGMGCVQDCISVVTEAGADGVAIADVLHYDRLSIPAIRDAVRASGLRVREL